MTVARERFDRFTERTRERFEDLAGRLAAEARKARSKAPALDDEYWKALRDLFTRDLTSEGLEALLRQESRDTLRFFTREVDLSDVRDRPWHERWALTVWRTFLAVAYRLSPWRRVAFALAVPILLVGWFRFLVILLAEGPVSLEPVSHWEIWGLMGATALFCLLVLELRDKLGLKGDLQDGIRIATAMRPANTVGGDYFDIVDIGPGRVAVVVGDVAGKGMPAALLMALLQGSLHTLLSAGLRGADLVAKLNAHLCASLPRNRLITLFYAELETATGATSYVNAGHNPPFLLRGSGPAERLAPNGMALGVLDDAGFSADSLSLGVGDALFLYTDGLTEAENAADQEYGDARLDAALLARRGASARELIDAVIAEVLHFCGPVKPRDDMTLLSLRREA